MNLYLIVILLLLVAGWLLEWIVDRLNLRHASTRIPKAFEGIYDAGKYVLSQRYLRDNTRLQQLQSNLMLPLTIAFILLGGYRWIQGVVVSVSSYSHPPVLQRINALRTPTESKPQSAT